MHSQDILKFIREHKGFTSIETLNRYFPNTSPEILTKAIYMYLKEKRS